MLYTPIPGTPLYAQLTAQGCIKDESEILSGDTHGQYLFNYRHPHIHDGQEAELIVRAFQRDFEVNGPSIARIVRTTLAGWLRYKNHPAPRIQRRFIWESRELATTYSAVIWAMKQYYRKAPAMRARMSRILRELHREFGWHSRLSAAVGGPYVLWKTWQEERRLARGWTYEPPTFYDRNDRAAGPHDKGSSPAERCRYVTPRFVARKQGISPLSTPAKPLVSAAHGRTEPRLPT
jgi:hypothetical protein